MKALLLAGTIVFLTGGVASSPTKAQSPDIDHGACPKTYFEKAKTAFRFTLLGKYDNFHVWPPRKFLYKTPPREGGQIVAGYLVPVQIDRSITGLWALLFKNEEIVKKFDPLVLEDLAIPAPVISIPKDERDWIIGNSGELGNITFQEWVVRGDTVQNWNELLTAETHSNQPATLGTYLIVKRQSLRRRFANVEEQTISETPSEVLIERSLVGRAEDRNEYHIARVVIGPRSLTNIVYARNTPFENATKAKWLEILRRTQILGDC